MARQSKNEYENELLKAILGVFFYRLMKEPVEMLQKIFSGRLFRGVLYGNTDGLAFAAQNNVKKRSICDPFNWWRISLSSIIIKP